MNFAALLISRVPTRQKYHICVHIHTHISSDGSLTCEFQFGDPAGGGGSGAEFCYLIRSEFCLV